MGLVLVRPVDESGLYEGGEIIDARLLADNWKALYSHLNGNLHASNIDVSTSEAGTMPSEMGIRFPDFFTAVGHKRKGSAHSHNGIDSAKLGKDSIGRDQIAYRSFGAWMYPSLTTRQIVLYGTADITSELSSTNTLLLDVPYDKYKWGNFTVDDEATAVPIVSIQVDDAVVRDTIKHWSAKLLGTLGYDPYLVITLYTTKLSGPRIVTPVRIHWMILITRGWS